MCRWLYLNIKDKFSMHVMKRIILILKLYTINQGCFSVMLDYTFSFEVTEVGFSCFSYSFEYFDTGQGFSTACQLLYILFLWVSSSLLV